LQTYVPITVAKYILTSNGFEHATCMHMPTYPEIDVFQEDRRRLTLALHTAIDKDELWSKIVCGPEA
jgi:hypothetical protein